MNATPEAVMSHHLKAFAENDLAEIMKDYTDESELWSPQGRVAGLAAIEEFFAQAFGLVPAGQTTFNLTQQIMNDDTVFIAWNTDSPVATVPLETDTFLFKDGKIALQTVAALINPKQPA